SCLYEDVQICSTMVSDMSRLRRALLVRNALNLEKSTSPPVASISDGSPTQAARSNGRRRRREEKER
ncbi:unnamed protein product, partial [Arctogadus glacialis]